MIRRQATEATVELIPIGDREHLVASGRHVGWKDLEDGGPAPRFASFRVAGVDEQPMQPGVEPIRIAEPRQLAPGDHQRLLNGVLGSSDVSEDPLGDREHSVGRRPRENRERFAIPSLRLLDEVPIHRLSIPERSHDGRASRRMSRLNGRPFNPAAEAGIPDRGETWEVNWVMESTRIG